MSERFHVATWNARFEMLQPMTMASTSNLAARTSGNDRLVLTA